MNYPEEYKVSSFCRSCGRDFSHDLLFDRHRTGSHDYDFSAEHPDGRRCKDDDELIASGMRPMTEEEMLSSKRHSHRVGYGVEMWFDPSELARMRKAYKPVSG